MSNSGHSHKFSLVKSVLPTKQPQSSRKYYLRSERSFENGIKAFSSDSADDLTTEEIVKYVMEPPSVRSNVFKQ